MTFSTKRGKARPKEFRDQPIKGPKGCVHIKKLRHWDKVTYSITSPRHGYLILLMARALPNGVVLGFYGRPRQ